jgi:hypothetical protein
VTPGLWLAPAFQILAIALGQLGQFLIVVQVSRLHLSGAGETPAPQQLSNLFMRGSLA